jgi:hypothetical protein
MHLMTDATNTPPAERKRPFPLNLIVIGGLAMLTLVLFMGLIWTRTEWQAVWIAARVILRVLPLPVWLMATAVALGWILLITRLWQQQ